MGGKEITALMSMIKKAYTGQYIPEQKFASNMSREKRVQTTSMNIFQVCQKRPFQVELQGHPIRILPVAIHQRKAE
jgi:hypothetical protein